MNIVQRILSKVIGQEISEEEMELVAGGAQTPCAVYHSEQAGGWCDDGYDDPNP